METKLNIAEILKNKPKGTKLYTDTFGEVSIEDIDTEEELGITLLCKDGDNLSFYNDGRYSTYGEPILVPSRAMRDWSKFQWKKGDALIDNYRKRKVFFYNWINNSYTKFVGRYCILTETENGEPYAHDEGTSIFNTNDFNCIKDTNSVQFYINSIEKLLGGKFNHETLEMESPEFKNGDIAFADYSDRQDVFIVFDKINLSRGYTSFIYLALKTETLYMGIKSYFFKKYICKLRYATEEERQQLFKALANEGKAWDAEKKMIVDLKSLWTPKPFDKVLVRNSDADKWLAGFFEKFEKSWNNSYHIMNLHHMTDFAFKQCIPYIGNESLLGTTKDVEE